MISHSYLFISKQRHHIEILEKELNYIYNWIAENDSIEKDFFIVGDFNLANKKEHNRVLCDGCSSLNDKCEPTSLGGKPYDHLFYRPEYSPELIKNSFEVVDMKVVFKDYWIGEGAYPSADHNLFKQYYSGHYPISFEIEVIEDDD